MTAIKTRTLVLTALLGLALPALAANPLVKMTTSLGTVEIELYPDKAPATVKNFLANTEARFYEGTLFHRVIPGFMIQGGGFEAGMKEKPKGASIRNEADNGLKNVAGNIAMARTPDPHSASVQFFINLVDNPMLDHTGKTQQGWGYAVFGRVVRGMDVVNRIAVVPTTSAGYHENVPSRDVLITRVEVMKPTAR
ncbi:MAG: peptidylprolyl isomerase [Thiobacillaceae bacterium]|nr:peptidylprolyl isomerase [Thiobacillaceae bacterium]